MDKKTFPLILLCILLALFWGQIMERIWPLPPSAKIQGTNQVSAIHSANQPAHLPPPVSPSAKFPEVSLIPKSIPAGSAKIAVLENDEFRVEFTSLGAGIQHVILKKYPDNQERSVVLNEKSPLPVLSAAVGDAEFLAPYEWITSPDEIRAVYQSANGLEISKKYTLKPEYQIHSEITVRNTGKTSINQATLQIALGMAAPLDAKDTEDYVGISFLSSDKAFHENAPALRKQVEKQQKPFEKVQPIIWAAVKNRFFTLLTTPSTPFASIQAEPYTPPSSSEMNAAKAHFGVVAKINSPPFELAPGASASWSMDTYAGPKEYEKLSSLGKNQGEVLDFGFFEFVSKVLLWVMSGFHRFFGNWGVAIIGVTIVIKLLFWPLTAMSTKSMKQMQALAPKMNALKEKYKDDSKKMNEEMMKMYRDYKINPMAGCLPMLVQIPIFIAFYNMLRTAIELRHAHFLWIRDLSVPDTVATIPGIDFPLNLMPLIMAVTMIWQTKMTPQAPNADPSMKMMMWLMPAMFLFFCYQFSSGLSLYWTAQNLLTVLQTYLTRDKPVEPPKKVKTKGRGFTFSRPIEKKS